MTSEQELLISSLQLAIPCIHFKKWIVILTKLGLPQLRDSTHNSLPSCQMFQKVNN